MRSTMPAGCKREVNHIIGLLMLSAVWTAATIGVRVMDKVAPHLSNWYLVYILFIGWIITIAYSALAVG